MLVFLSLVTDILALIGNEPFQNIEVHVVFLIDFEKTRPDSQIRTVLESTRHNGVKQGITTVYPSGDVLKEETFNCTGKDKIT